MYQVSILVPIYGVEEYIERCVRSLFEQTYENLEYIFVDDCTPDKSIDILNRVMEDYPERKAQVRIIRHDHNRGLAAARNTALDAATSPFISHVDSDDYLDRDAIRLLVEKQVETGADIVSGNYYVIDSDEIKEAFEPEYKDKQEMLQKAISAYSGGRVVWRRLINSHLYNDHHIRPKEGVNNGEDWQQTAKLVYYADKVARIDDHIYYYNRTNSNSYVSVATKKSGINLWEQAIESAIILKDFFAEKEQIYIELSNRTVIFALKTQMSLAAIFHKKSFFEKIKHIITTEYADYYDEVGWNNPLLRAFMCNYTLNGMYRRFLRNIKIALHH